MIYLHKMFFSKMQLFHYRFILFLSFSQHSDFFFLTFFFLMHCQFLKLILTFHCDPKFFSKSICLTNLLGNWTKGYKPTSIFMRSFLLSIFLPTFFQQFHQGNKYKPITRLSPRENAEKTWLRRIDCWYFN